MQLGRVTIRDRAVLAPMAGVTDLAYRRICAEMGAAYTITEMVSSKAVEFGDKKTQELCVLDDKTRPAAIQLFGNEPHTMAFAAKKLLEHRPDAVDINMGCPVPKIAGQGSGSALMRNPKLCGKIVAAVKSAVNVPVTVKIRSGWDDDSVNAVEVACICADAGAAAICVHGRTKTQMYAGKADWDLIRQVKRAVSVPVIGNGDVTDAGSAVKMLEETGCDLVMIGRRALGNPWIFREINGALAEKTCILPPPSLEERLLLVRKHIGLLCSLKGENRGMREARKHVAWYLHGMKNAAGFRKRAGELCTLQDLDALLMDVYETNRNTESMEKPI